MTSEEQADASKKIQVRYYAMLREHAGCSGETIVTKAATARDLYDELKAKHAWPWEQTAFRVAINDDLREWSAAFESGDVISILPPVSGG